MQYQTESIRELNSLLRSELAASETYAVALKGIGDMYFRNVLCDCQQSHERRARMLTERIAELGGEPAHGSGIWGTFAKVITAGATKVGYEATVAALEEGEDMELNDYRKCINKIDTANARFVAGMLPDQEETRTSMCTLHKTIS